MRVLLVTLCSLLATTVWAEAPLTSPRPEPRTDTGAVAVARAAVINRILQNTAASNAPVGPVMGGGVLRSPRAPARPADLKRPIATTAAAVRVPQSTKGSVCGDPAIRGATLSRIAGRIRGCGVDAPVRVTSVSGVALSTGATMDCATAKALKTWVEGTVKPGFGRSGGGVSGLKVAAHYSCRTRNNKAGARVSEHGKGRAIDISAILLRNGTAVSVLKGWPSAKYGRVMKAMHKGACGPFGTVLGPNSDRYHRDHFHLDTARYRSGSYCR